MREAGLKWLTDTSGALEHPVVRITLGAAAVAVAAGLIAPLLMKGKPELARDIRTRSLTWIALIVFALTPIIAAPLGAILLVLILSMLCYREFARATGLFRQKRVSAIVALGILAVAFANIDNWPGLRSGLIAFVPMLICIVSILKDHPKGYIERCALGAAAFLLLGSGLGRLGALAADVDYRPILCMVLLCCQLGDVAAYCFGKSMGRRHLFPHTSPNKTIAGHVGALLTVTPLAMFLGHLTFKGQSIDTWPHLLALGLLIAVTAQLGDLLISSVKRDIGIKDMGAMLPGHGGLLDRCNSLVLAAPAVYHYLVFFRGVGEDLPMRIITSGHP